MIECETNNWTYHTVHDNGGMYRWRYKDYELQGTITVIMFKTTTILNVWVWCVVWI